MLRSDFANEKDKTFVELDFASGHVTYNVKRVIKKSGQDVALSLPDGTVLTGDRNVRSKMDEIVGLDREQFAQIVMIAQNDFLRFLQSGTDDRLKILRRIFGTEALRNFQDRLKARAKQENEKRALIIHEFNRREVDVYKREECFAEWDAQIKIDKTELSRTDKGLAQYDAIKRELAAKLAMAEDLEKKFSDLVAVRLLLEAHKSRANEIATLKKRATIGETALRKVKPSADDAARTVANRANAQANLAEAKTQEAAAFEELALAKSAVEELPPLADAQNVFATLSKKLETAVERLKKLTSLQKTRDEIAGKQTALLNARGELAAVCKTLSNLPSSDDCRAVLDQLTRELARDENACAQLSALRRDFTDIIEKQNALSKAQSEFEALNANFLEVDGKCRSLEEAFLRGQAGILAKGLTDGKPCPVCGSAVHPAPAALSLDEVTEAELQRVKSARDNTQNKRDEKSADCNSAIMEIKTLSTRFLADLIAHSPDATLGTADARLAETANATKTRVIELTKKKNDAEKTLVELKTKLDGVTAKRDELNNGAVALESEIGALVKRFTNDFFEFTPSAEWETSKTELAQLLDGTRNEANALTTEKTDAENSLQKLTANWESASKRKSSAELAHKSAQTLATERDANEREASGLCAEAQAKYTETLREHGFSGETEYAAALITENELADMSKRLADHEKNGERLVGDLKRLESETADKERPDMGRLTMEAETANAESFALGEKRDEIKGRLDKTETVLKELRQAAADFERADRSYAAVKQLSDTANGKLDFETYAQMAFFERVLSAANHRLKAMSQNRYALLRKTEGGDGRAKTGLEIEAFDAYTGKARSANSLSGGESFMASLSLALGLSDVVQQSAGGIQLDAMFIDEGFGTLDTETLDIAIKTLSEMAGADRTIGIISHVTELRERIDKQIQIEKTTAGSKISVVL